ncbi:MAG: KH domain-containing protein [Xanthomonadaceae bacterium]|nr:KH domain-containing protein [Rhodospirillaceae bacterium]NIA17582.1 KH domain-containing protein [Xanthomonadaceae bacterium]
MADKTHDQEFIEYIVRAIVSHPDDVKTVRTVDEMGVLLTLKINPEDMGFVVGRQGQTARALRTLLKIIGAKANARINLKIEEPEGGRRSTPKKEEKSETNVEEDMVDDLKI